MKLQQLRYISAMLRNNLNVSETADALYTSQPGVSKQIRLLEEELGVEIFRRSGKQIVSVTEAGEEIIALANDILGKVDGIRTVSREYANPNIGDLRIATTHTQARYVLPPIVKQFSARYPRVNLQLHQGTPNQMAEMLGAGVVDMAIATESMQEFQEFVALPAYRWYRSLLVPPGHPLHKLHKLGSLTLQALAQYPLVTYVFGFNDGSRLDRAFRAVGMTPKVVLTAVDADIIKTYVRQGMGVGIIAEMAYDERIDEDLVSLAAEHLFEPSTAHICFSPKRRFRQYVYDFCQLFAAHLNKTMIDEAMAAEDAKARAELFAQTRIPLY